MESSPSLLVILKKVVFITVIGFATIILSGPALAVAGTLLPFFCVGLLIYLFYQAVTLGPRVAIGMVAGLLKGIARVIISIPVGIGRFVSDILPRSLKGFLGKVFAIPLWIVRRFGAVIGWAFGLIGAMLSFTMGVTFDALAGAFIGGLLGVVGGMEHHDLEFRVPAGALLGLAIGALAGATRSKPAKAKAAPVVLAIHEPERVPVLQVAK